MQVGLIVIVSAVAFRFRSMNAKLDAETPDSPESSERKGVETVSWRFTL
jgi:hypothetical protein